jgi:hypothetical protein
MRARRSKRNENFSAIIHYAPLSGHYARLRQGQQAGEFLMTGSAVDPVIDCQIGGCCSTSAFGVRRDKAALSSGCKAHPANAAAGSNRSSHGGNEVAEAFG